MKPSFGNSLPGKLDHGRGNVRSNYLIAGIRELSRPNPTAASEIHDKSLPNAVSLEQLQKARPRACSECAEASVVNVGEIVVVSVLVAHGYLVHPAERSMPL